ncbi:hypothetical protein D3C78_1926090 [compost metagenome]
MAHPALLEAMDGLLHLRLGVHDERAVRDDRLVDGHAPQQEHMGRVHGFQLDRALPVKGDRLRSRDPL